MATLRPTGHNDMRRYEALKRALAKVGLIRRGSLLRRLIPCGKPGCRCQSTPPKLHGPYFQWTRKIRGKTVTLRLTEAQAELVEGWIANGRLLDTILHRMEQLSLRLTQRRL